MKSSHLKMATGGAVIAAIAAAAWAAAPGQKKEGARNTPESWPYELRNGKRVPRVPRTVNPDGSWVEKYKAGNCWVTRTGRQGEVRETRECD